MNRREFLRSIAVVFAFPSIPIVTKEKYNIVGTVTGRVASQPEFQFLQKRQLAKMWQFARNYGAAKETFIKNLGRMDAEPLAIYRNYKELFIADFKEIEMSIMVRRLRCNGHAEIVK